MKIKILFFVLFISSVVASPRILIKIPTRERPDKFFYCLNLFYAKLSYKYDTTFLVSCDCNDMSMNNLKVQKRLSLYPSLRVVWGKSKSKIDAYNRDMDFFQDYDILIVVADDMIPILDDYDDIIVKEMLEWFPNFDGVLKFDDGCTKSILNTIPIMGMNFYKNFEYIYHPEYKSFFCDLEMTLVSKLLNKEVVIDKIIIKHENPALGNTPADSLYINALKDISYDRDVFKIRKRKKFDLDVCPEKMVQFDWLDSEIEKV